MPSGKTHNAINLSVTAAAVIAWHLSGKPWLSSAEAGAAVAGAVIGTLLISPDLDLGDQNVEAKSNWGPFGFIWYPYGRMSRHRGQAHSYLRGPLMRVAYLMAIAALVIFIIQAVGLWQWKPLSFAELWKSPLLWVGFGGYLAAQWMHLIADGIYPWQHGRL